MKVTTALTLALAVLLSAGCAADQSRGAPLRAADGAFEQVQARERAWLDAYERADADAMADILADEFVISFPNGRQDDRNATLNQIKRGRAGTHFWTENVRATRDGPRVVLQGIVISSDGTHQMRQSYTDVWKWAAGAWRVVSSKLSIAPAP